MQAKLSYSLYSSYLKYVFFQSFPHPKHYLPTSFPFNTEHTITNTISLHKSPLYSLVYLRTYSFSFPSQIPHYLPTSCSLNMLLLDTVSLSNLPMRTYLWCSFYSYSTNVLLQSFHLYPWHALTVQAISHTISFYTKRNAPLLHQPPPRASSLNNSTQHGLPASSSPLVPAVAIPTLPARRVVQVTNKRFMMRWRWCFTSIIQSIIQSVSQNCSNCRAFSQLWCKR